MTEKIKHVKAGDPVKADLWNRILAKLEPFAKLSVAACGYLRLTSHPNGKALSMGIPKPVMARLSGASSPYSWTAVMETAGGTFTDRTAGMTGGTANVYEVNGKSGLAGKVVPITWTAAGDWRFQWVGYGAACGWRFITTGCLGDPLVGCLVEIRQSGTLVDSCTTAEDGAIAKVKRVSGGTGYTNGSYTNGTFSGGGGSGGTFSYTVSGGVIQPTITMINKGSGYTSAPTPVFSAGAGSGASATAYLRASCLLTPPAGTYDVTVSGPSGGGFEPYVSSHGFSCSSSADVELGIALGAASTHVCTSICNYPVKKSLFTSDGLGTHNLVNSGGGWTATAQVPGFTDGCGTPTMVNVTYSFGISGNGWQLSIGWRYICCGSGPINSAYQAAGTFVGTAASNVVSACPPAFSVTLTLPVRDIGSICFSDPPATGGPGNQTPGGGGMLTVTE